MLCYKVNYPSDKALFALDAWKAWSHLGLHILEQLKLFCLGFSENGKKEGIVLCGFHSDDCRLLDLVFLVNQTEISVF